ncbi:unnamed protein product, partial [Onchocerca flexuosa]|uniref:Uncharacterized protein n=1 Tax=Onchocerca flexuosa TaxID=387005 RepID=A0A183HJ26_9BILA
MRNERHSVCVADLAELKGTTLSVPSKHPFVDSKLASFAVRNVNNMCHRPLSAIETRSSMWNLPCQSSPLQLIVDKNDTFENYCSPLTNASIMQTVPHVESKPASPFSNYAILIKEISPHRSHQQFRKTSVPVRFSSKSSLLVDINIQP